MKAVAFFAAMALVGASSASAQTMCRASPVTGRTTCMGSEGTSSIRTSPITGRTTITNSDGTMTSGRTRESLNGRNSTFTTDQGDTYTARRSLSGRNTTVTNPNGSTTNCHTSLLGTVTCY